MTDVHSLVNIFQLHLDLDVFKHAHPPNSSVKTPHFAQETASTLNSNTTKNALALAHNHLLEIQSLVSVIPHAHLRTIYSQAYQNA